MKKYILLKVLVGFACFSLSCSQSSLSDLQAQLEVAKRLEQGSSQDKIRAEQMMEEIRNGVSRQIDEAIVGGGYQTVGGDRIARGYHTLKDTEQRLLDSSNRFTPKRSKLKRRKRGKFFACIFCCCR